MLKKFSIFMLAFSIMSFPYMYTSAAGIVPDCGRVTTTVTTDAAGKQHTESVMSTPCDFNFLMKLINNLISFLLFTIATPLAALAFCYAGFIMISAGGNSEKVTKAKHIFTNVVVGYIIGLAAWLIVHTIIKAFGVEGGDQFLK